ncbi:hypothetical protein AB0G67_45990 [Streptomyces sp. NPDC021056]|uniref:hypothetical protein n=1 Tax=Streptomyces sp. NPDC021056 TaxID=3155012 RepID=UPI0033CE0B7C
MHGTLACERCVINYGWNWCTTSKDGFIDGHTAITEDQVDVDSSSHDLERGTHRTPVQRYPSSGLLQGIEAYLRSASARKGIASGTPPCSARPSKRDEQRSSTASRAFSI